MLVPLAEKLLPEPNQHRRVAVVRALPLEAPQGGLALVGAALDGLGDQGVRRHVVVKRRPADAERRRDLLPRATDGGQPLHGRDIDVQQRTAARMFLRSRQIVEHIADSVVFKRHF